MQLGIWISDRPEATGMSADDMLAVREQLALELVPSFSARERLAVQYARLLSQTPFKFHPKFIKQLKAHFTEREMVILASTATQVNDWAQLIQAPGIPRPDSVKKRQNRDAFQHPCFGVVRVL